MIIRPTAVHLGNYHIVRSALPSARAFVLDEADRVFEIMSDCSLREAGLLRGRSQARQASRVAFHPILERAGFLTEGGMAITGFAQSMNYRFYLFDLIKMERIEELVIDGFEPAPTREMYPRLDDDTLFSTVLC